MNAKKKTDSAPKLLSFDEYLTSLEEMEAAEKKPAPKKAKKAPAKKPSAKKAEKAPAKKAAKKTPAVAPAAETTTIALPRGVELAMVRIPGKDYWMGKFPVTQEQWVAVMGRNPSVDSGLKRPVEQVSWDDCQKFLKKLNAQPAAKASGLVFRLPDEDEWETACRAGATGDYCKLADGTEITVETLGEVAWFKDNADRETHPVGEKKPNAFGLYDMHGNVGEWTATADGAYRVLRGGSWYFSARWCESSNRCWKRPGSRLGYFGFRLCASGADEKEEAAPAKKKARADVPAIVEGIIASMVPIPGKDYRMGKFPVTQAQWEAVMGENPSEFRIPENPVETVSWDDCQAFLKTLNAQPAAKASGLVFRLPEADEWEYACRAGATGKYCKLADGTEITEETLGEVAWFGKNSDEMTHPVGEKKPNAFGLYDMHGNVCEWTATADGEYRVGSGGGWTYKAEYCESSFRDWFDLSNRNYYIGFRLCASGRAATKAPAKKAPAKKTAKARAVEPAVVEGIIASMVSIPRRDYRMGKFPVTQAQWEAVMGENPSEFKGAENPVENVSWDDCQAFLKTLNAQPAAKASGLVFRLPNEYEWENACRAGAKGKYCKLADRTEITEKTLKQVAWFDKNSDGTTHPVGQKKPNAFRLYDMHGNVCEWTATAVGKYRVRRGGCYHFSARNCDSYYRYTGSPSDRIDNLGFRLCASGRAD